MQVLVGQLNPKSFLSFGGQEPPSNTMCHWNP